MYKLNLPNTPEEFGIYMERVSLYRSFPEHAVQNPRRDTAYRALRPCTGRITAHVRAGRRQYIWKAFRNF